jgi:hypothetical protein
VNRRQQQGAEAAHWRWEAEQEAKRGARRAARGQGTHTRDNQQKGK